MACTVWAAGGRPGRSRTRFIKASLYGLLTAYTCNLASGSRISTRRLRAPAAHLFSVPASFVMSPVKLVSMNGKPVANPPAQILWQSVQDVQRFVGNEQLKICASHKFSSVSLLHHLGRQSILVELSRHFGPRGKVFRRNLSTAAANPRKLTPRGSGRFDILVCARFHRVGLIKPFAKRRNSTRSAIASSSRLQTFNRNQGQLLPRMENLRRFGKEKLAALCRELPIFIG